MNKMISDELMSRFYAGDVTGEEFKKVLLAAEHDPDLKEEIEIMTSISDDLSKIKIKREDVSNATIVSMLSEPLTIYALAAQSREYGKDMKAPNDCVVQCEQFVLQQFNIDTSLEALNGLSKKNGWLKEGGTPLHHIGRLLSEHKLSVVRRYDCNINIINHELGDGCKVIVAINAEKLNSDDVDLSIPNHAVVVLSTNEQEARIFDPQNAQETSYPINRFINAWKDSHYYLVSVTKRGVRKYKPAPIDASHFEISDDLEELLEAIAENSHEIWALGRKKEGWSYGPERNDEKKEHPDLIPYSDLTETEKDYDRKTARGILELVQRLGYKIEKDKK